MGRKLCRYHVAPLVLKVCACVGCAGVRSCTGALWQSALLRSFSESPGRLLLGGRRELRAGQRPARAVRPARVARASLAARCTAPRDLRRHRGRRGWQPGPFSCWSRALSSGSRLGTMSLTEKYVYLRYDEAEVLWHEHYVVARMRGSGDYYIATVDGDLYAETLSAPPRYSFLAGTADRILPPWLGMRRRRPVYRFPRALTLSEVTAYRERAEAEMAAAQVGTGGVASGAPPPCVRRGCRLVRSSARGRRPE